MSTSRTGARQLWVSVRALAVFTVVLGLLYPLVVTGIAQLAMPDRANGSLVGADGSAAAAGPDASDGSDDSASAAVGSSLIGQSFLDADGEPLPEWFQSRPSAAGDGYDGAASGGSNLGPENADLVAAIAERRAAVAAFEGVDPADVPADALTASASGLDPHISPAYALLQVPRVAAERGLAEEDVRALVDSMIQGRDLGYLGEPTVDVLRLNIALDAL